MSVLDDDDTMLHLIRLHVRQFNACSEHTCLVDFYSNPAEYMELFHHDLALIDVNLGPRMPSGFEVAAGVFKKCPEVVSLIMSNDFKASNESMGSIVAKSGFKMSEVFTRFLNLRKASVRNVLEVSVRGSFHRGMVSRI